MNALSWILPLAVVLVAVGCAVYARIDRDNWKTRAEIAEAAGIVNLKNETADKCAGCMFKLQNAYLYRQQVKALALMKGGDFYAAQKTLEGGGSDG